MGKHYRKAFCSIRETKMKSLHFFASVFILFLAFNASAQYKIDVLDSNTFQLGEGVILRKTSFRGLSVADDKTIWISGSRGTIAKSIDGGKSFSFQQLKGYEKSDFRDIEAFDDKRAIIMSSGTPAYILKTMDGGQTWKEVYKNTDSAYFLDAMDFWDDKKGMLVGDPINGHFILLQTIDGGETWQQLDTSKTPNAFPGEAVFAASGTSLRCWGENEFGFVSGGKVSRLFWNYKGNLRNDSLRIISGNKSSGAFSFCFKGDYFLIVGGDFMRDSFNGNNTCAIMVTDFMPPTEHDVFGYRSSIESIDEYGAFISCGINGVDFYYPNMERWISINKQSFNVVRKAKKGKAVFLAGDKGKIGKLIY